MGCSDFEVGSCGGGDLDHGACRGCNSSNGLGGLQIGQNNQADAEQGVDKKLDAKVVQGNCPQITLRDGTAYLRKYARGGEDDSEKVLFQAAIADTTRQCSVTGDQMTINVVVAGCAASGPAGKPGPIKMPIRVVVLENRSNRVIYSELTDLETKLLAGNPTTQFLFSKPGVTIPIADSRSVSTKARRPARPRTPKGERAQTFAVRS